MLHHCDDHITAAKKESKEEKKDAKEEPKRDASFPSFAVIAIALIAMGEDIGAEMSLRQFNHLVSDYRLFFYCANLEVFLIKMLYGEPTIRKAVPLAIGLVSASNPHLPILDTLSKYSHDNDLQVAINAGSQCWRSHERSLGLDAETTSRLLSTWKGTWLIFYCR